MKVITICGSLKFYEEMMKIAVQMELAGNVVLTPIIPINENKEDLTKEEVSILGKMHKKKIELSDAILVVNVNGYIGNSTKEEMEFARSLKKEVIYYTDLVEKGYY